VSLPAQEASKRALAPAAPAADQDAAKRWKELRAAAETYRIDRESNPPVRLTLLPEPVLRWSNPLPRRGVYDGAVFIWVADGRPEVVASFYRNKLDAGVPKEFHEFKSLSASPMTASFDGRAIWTPRTAGVVIKRVPGAPKPASDVPGRLRQMRAMARDFHVGYVDEVKQHMSLRLLTQPLYRYETGRPELVDGALFAFVLATDPEALLLFEARPVRGGAPAWHFGFGRMVSRGLRGWYLDQLVWEVPATPHLPNNPYMTAPAPVQPQ
jgi:hypothetical protein